MDTSSYKPSPVVFKTLARSNASLATKCIKLAFFTIEYYPGTTSTNGYYLLISDSDPSHPLRLYQPAMNKLIRQLDFAFKEADKMRGQQDLADNENYDCGIINSYGQMMVRLVLSTFHNHVNIWLRLYTLDENQECLPTKTGVRFSPKDDLAALAHFISGKK